MQVRKFTKARDRKLHNLYTNISGCIDKDARFQNNTLILFSTCIVLKDNAYWKGSYEVIPVLKIPKVYYECNASKR